MLVDVALPIPVRRSFTYEVPEALRSRVRRGVRARVPFGRRTLTGVILGEANGDRPAVEIKRVGEILDSEPVLPEPVLELALWLADYYQAPLGEAIRLALAPLESSRTGNSPFESGRVDNSPLESSRLALPTLERDSRFVRLAPGGGERSLPLARRASRLRAILDALANPARADGWMQLEDLRLRTEATAASLRQLETRGLIETAIGNITAGGTARRLIESAPVPTPARWPELTPLQSVAAASIVEAIDRGEGGVFLLRGVTGSGKTEVYFAAARRALDRGKGAIFLVPEIGLTPVFTRRVRERFGEQVAVLHSRLSPGERLREWRRARSGRAPLVVGPRSALFAPIARLGLVVVDEEHDASYKQEEMPRYHARDLALVRARLEGAVAVLGSATPSIESWHAASAGRYRMLSLGERIGGRPLPPVEIVDMREEFRERGAPVVLSQKLVQALAEAKAAEEQAVILLNRRGYAAFAQCRACGEPFGCPRCSVSLVYHRSDETLRCHYCGHKRDRPEACDACASPHISFHGEGTERVERHLAKVLPDLRVTRLDRDTARGRGSHERILAAFEAGEFDVLLGTQMVAKGHDFPRVTVVGVLAADAILGFPDFRAAERTFQLLTQVAGRAGRGDAPGRVLVQAYWKDHYALAAAARHDPEEFFSKEIQYRRALSYPPFTNLAAVTVSGKDLARASARARQVAGRLLHHGGGRVQVLGPALAPIARLRGAYRFQVMLKARARRRLGDALRRALDELAIGKGGTRDLTIDVDPLQLL